MSALTSENLAEIARQRLGWLPADIPRLLAMVPIALKSLALKVARRADFEAFRKDTPTNCVNGVITLTDGTILVETLLETGSLVLDGKVAVRAPSYEALTLTMTKDVYRWSLFTPTKIHVKNLGTGLLGEVNKAGTLTANHVLTLLEIPDNYDEQLTEEMSILATGKVEESPAPSFTGKTDGLNVNLNS